MDKKINNATKWSFITEILAKLAAPITNMVLARLLTPEIFGVVATITMVTSFAEIFSDAGFQKYLVQHNFIDDEDFNNGLNTAFWTNLGISLTLWILIFIFRAELARLVGSEGYGNALAIAALVLPMYSFSSIQLSIFRRKLDFKTIFRARIVGIVIPFLVTVPIAMFTHSHWSLIIGNLAIQLANSYYLTIASDWKPQFKYNINSLKEMWTFSIWTLTEQLLGWANLNIGIFVVGTILSSYYLGLYKMSMGTVNQVIAVITNTLSPVIMSSLSKLRDDKEVYLKAYYEFMRTAGMLVIPMGIGIFMYKDLVTLVLLGNQWMEASNFIGLWALVRSLYIALCGFYVDVCISLEKPIPTVLLQLLSIFILIPSLYVSAHVGYHTLYIVRSCIVIISVIIELIALYKIADISFIKLMKNIYPCFISAGIMFVVGNLLKMVSSNIIWSFVSIAICAVTYFVCLIMFPSYGSYIKEMIKNKNIKPKN